MLAQVPELAVTVHETPNDDIERSPTMRASTAKAATSKPPAHMYIHVQLYVSMQQKMRHANGIAIHTTTYKSAAGAKAPPPHLHVPASQLPMRILLFLALATHVLRTMARNPREEGGEPPRPSRVAKRVVRPM